MEQTRLCDIRESVGTVILFKGWVANVRSSGSLLFLELRDGSGYVQAVVSEKDLDADSWKQAQSLTLESSLVLEGLVTKHPKKENTFEIQAQKVTLIQRAEEYPIAKKEHGPEFLLDHRHLWLRSKRQWAIQRIRDVVAQGMQEFLHMRGFIKIDTPIFTPNACEGATTLYELNYLDQGKVYLSQSGQLYLEAAVMSVGRGYDFGPVFRAEKSKTKRHLNEFWMMDAEAVFVEHEENMRLQEELLLFVIKKCLDNCQVEFDLLERNIAPLQKVKGPFTRLTYTEAIKELNRLGSDIVFGEDLGNDDEVLLTKESESPVFIHKWPKSIKPFYMKTDPENPDLVLNDDLIGIEGSGELAGGSQREDDYQKLKSSIEKEGLNGPEYAWYLDLRAYGSVPHSGFGFGLERIVRWVVGIEHVRETIPFPRVVNRIRP